MDAKDHAENAALNKTDKPVSTAPASGFKRVEAVVSHHRWNLGGLLTDLVKGTHYTVDDRTAKDMQTAGHAVIVAHDVERPAPTTAVAPAMTEGQAPTGAQEIKKTVPQEKLPDDLETFLSRMKPAHIVVFAKKKLDLDLDAKAKKLDLVKICLEKAAEINASIAELEAGETTGDGDEDNQGEGAGKAQ